MVWTVPLVMVIVMRYNLVVDGDSDGDPVDVVLHDKFILALILIYCILLILLVYFI